MNYNLSFQELAKLQREILSKQPSYTLEEKRAQILRLMFQASAEINEFDIKNHLKMYFPVWTHAQIEDGFNEIKTIIARETEIGKVDKEIARYLKRNQSK